MKSIGDIQHQEIDETAVASLLPMVSGILETVGREELIRRLLSRELSRYLTDYRNAPDLNVSAGKRREQKKTEKSATLPKKNGKRKPPSKNAPCERFTRFLFNVGKRDGVNPGRLIGRINDMTGRSDIRIGKVKIMDRAALLEADSNYVREVLGAFDRHMINGRPVSVKLEGERREAKRAKGVKNNRRKFPGRRFSGR